jgi:ACS family D-galactonate transporter-like MFS transporter
MSYAAATSSALPVFTRWTIVILLMGFAALGHFNRVGIAVAGGEIFIPQLGISETRMGWVYTTFLIFYTLGMLPGGWLIDRIGAARTMTLYGLTMGIFVCLTGALGWVTNTPHSLWLGLLLIRGLAGICSAPLHPGAAHVVSDLMSDRRRATANGMVTAGALIGIACCYPAFGWLMDRLNWPLAFIISGASLIGYSLVWSRLAIPILPATKEVNSSERADFDSKAVWTLLRQRNLWLLTLSYAAYGYFQYLFFYWMSYYFEKVLHVPDLESRQATFYIMLAQGAGMAIGGLSTDAVCKLLGKVRGRRTIVMTGMGVGALFGLVGVNVTGQWNVAVALAISMAALGICEGVFWTTATDIGGKSRGFSGAFMNTGGNVGGLISPVLTPVMAEQIGWSGAITVACIISALGGAVWFAIQLPGDSSLNSEYDTY